jgi:4-hydroxy-3-polyprenylbenzoate decarboxylase
VGIPPQEDAWLGKATERIFLAPIKMTMVPEIMDMDMPVEGVFHNLVITKINKEYAGQGQKVMNAMWGAGQMMFNKILVLADQHIRIQDYSALARYVFKNLNPVTDVVFSSGPMDVLDHSCSKMGFGGKMCIDGTSKFPEEIEEDGLSGVSLPPAFQIADRLLQQFSEIKSVNALLTEQDIPCLIVGVKKERPGHIRSLHSSIASIDFCRGIKMILYVEHTVDPLDLPTALWRFCNNLDPKRDQHLHRYDDAHLTGCLGLDGTRKTKEHDNFQRDWPNIIVANEATIQAVDAKWDNLNLGPFIASPSLKYKDQLYGSEAIVDQ